jgi:cell division protease FtsH
LGGGHDEREQTLNQILVEMDGFDRDTNVIVLAATNRPDVLDSALLRPGRFDRRIYLDLPDIREREAILKIHSKNKPLDPSVDLSKVAVRTPGFSGADLANLMNEAAILAARHDKKSISQEDIYNSTEKVLLGPERKGRLVSENERKTTAFHEAGHALVAAGLKDSDPVHKISIVSRGRVGGYTIKLPVEERRIKTRRQFLADLAVILGGYAAEEELLGEISTGATQDLKQAAELSRDLVTRFGMSEKFGPVAFGNGEEAVFLGRGIVSDNNYSEKIAGEIDDEIKKLIGSAHKLAKKIVNQYKPALKKIAEKLLEKELLEQEEFYAIIRRFKIKPGKV